MKEKNNKNKKLSITKKVFIGIGVVFLAIILSICAYGYKLSNKVERVEVNREEVLNTGTEGPKVSNDVITIALFGTDYMGDTIGAADTTMIVSIDPNSKKINLCSLMRDTYMDLVDGGKQNLNYTMSSGGHELILKTMNYNFDLKIDKFVQVDLNNLPKIIDKLGGVNLNLTNEEVVIINSGLKDAEKIDKAGNVLLNGTQTASYCRIRSTAGRDYKRTERQRDVLEALFKKMSSVSITQVPGIIEELLPLVSTNMTNMEMMSIASNVISTGITNLNQGRFPLDGHHNSEWTDMYHIIMDKDATKKEIHKFLYGIE